MSPVTEVVFIPLAEGQHPEDPSSSLKPAFDKILQTIISQPGAQRLHWARQIEKPTIATMFIDWNSIADHQKFIDSEPYKPFMDEVLGLTAGAPTLHHVHFNSPPADALTLGGASEVLSIYFPAAYTAEDIKTFEANFAIFEENVKASTSDVKAISVGWAEEELTIPGTEDKGKLFQAVIAWTTMQHHLDYRNTQTFKDNIPLLRGAKDVKAVVVFHITTQEVKKQ